MSQSQKGPNDNQSIIAQRRSSWEASLAAVSYINSVTKQPQFNIRQSDKITALSLILATLATVLCLLLHKPTGLSMQLMAMCDFFLGVSLVIYVCNRLGIITSLHPRQASLIWQLMKAFAFVGVFITFNLAIALSLILSSVSLSNLHLP
jgi:hypothetical protein